MFTDEDIINFRKKGISPEVAEGQIAVFVKGLKPVNICRPATPGDGIEVFDEGGILMYAGLFDKYSHNWNKIKFIPASGAATRMFKDLYDALNSLADNPHQMDKWLGQNPGIQNFFLSIKKFPFIDDLNEVCRNNRTRLDDMLANKYYPEILELILDKKGLDYGSLPKGVLKFHKYHKLSRTPFEEHISEASQYLLNAGGKLNIHFTVSPEHLDNFKKLAGKEIGILAEKGVILEVDFSVQDPSTDTMAVDINNRPFRKTDGTILFRPGGHGALLKNLNGLNEDLIFIGNIDNVATDKYRQVRVLHKKLLGGYLIEKVNMIRQLLHSLENNYSMAVRNDVMEFVKIHVSADIFNVLKELKEKSFISKSFNVLNRPVRVCGMIRNYGEPGGGPFWVRGDDGIATKQIIESAQADLNDPFQKQAFSSSTHFNPVDIACCISNFKGEKFNLSEYRDDKMAFISSKSVEGRGLKALELPGLWNGSMAGWLTFFVEVPVVTFSPVKTVFDLLRPEHQEN